MEGAKTQLFGSWGGHLTTFSRMKIDEAFFFFFFFNMFTQLWEKMGDQKELLKKRNMFFFFFFKIIIFIYLVSVRDLTMNLKE
jgi:hypothetical protein